MKCQVCKADVPEKDLPKLADRKQFGIYCDTCLRGMQSRPIQKEDQ